MNLSPKPGVPGYDDLLNTLKAHDASRTAFLTSCLTKLGLDASDTPTATPALSSLHLSALTPSDVPEMLSDWESIITRSDGEEYVRCEQDTFLIEKQDSRWEKKEGDEGIMDYEGVLKRIVPHEENWPDCKETPCFQHNVFYSSLREFRGWERGAERCGDQILYGEVLTSTNTILEKYVPVPLSLSSNSKAR
ncbi:hypothetical protein IMZ48_11475 [Candidatus Bathyarchaeota archaeon]|nr:hypothetical protein [Candidatus Bathyarchaeota archaeon]